jgi:ribosomal protein L7/L12
MNDSVKILCPYCYSPDLAMCMEGMNSTSAGAYAIPAGNVDNNNMELKCKSCDHTFKSGDGKLFQEYGNLAQPQYQSNANQILNPDELYIYNMCNTQDKFSAVKYCVLTYGWSLKEAKTYVDNIIGKVVRKPKATSAMESEIDEGEVISIIRTHGKLNAIKFVRDNSGWSLKQSKDYVDNLGEKSGATLGQKKGCFIATACYGDYNAPEVKLLRHYRDEVLQQSIRGRAFIKVYYTCSPPLANIISRSERKKELVRKYFLVPLLRFIKTEY